MKIQIKNISYCTPNVNLSLSWPLGADPPTQPLTRFDVIHWEYFTETHLYIDSSLGNMKELKGMAMCSMTFYCFSMALLIILVI